MSKNNFEKNTSQKIPLKQTEVCNDACYLVPPGIAITKTGSTFSFQGELELPVHALLNIVFHAVATQGKTVEKQWRALT